MPSILTDYDGVDFLAGRPFTYLGEKFEKGDDVPDAKSFGNLESMIRSRFLIPVIDDSLEGKPFQFHREVKPRSLALRKLGLGNKEETPSEPVEEGEWNPADHGVNEVLDHVDEYPDELLSVYALEEQGKARSTLLKELDKRLNKAAEEEEQNG